ncbi:hypothetical protein GN956_G9970 [Arapaima gigas]
MLVNEPTCLRRPPGSAGGQRQLSAPPEQSDCAFGAADLQCGTLKLCESHHSHIPRFREQHAGVWSSRRVSQQHNRVSHGGLCYLHNPTPSRLT